MKFVKIDTNLSTPASKAAAGASEKATDHSDGDGGYMYLDQMLDKTFITDYFLQ